jgi:hypothetical protein
MQSRCCWPPDKACRFRQAVLDLFPQAGAAQRLFDDLIEVGLARGEPVDAGAVGDILVDRLGEGVRLLEHHTDAGAQLHDVHVGRVDIFAVKLDRAFHARVRDRVVHAVDGAQERRFAAADGPMKAVTFSR